MGETLMGKPIVWVTELAKERPPHSYTVYRHFRINDESLHIQVQVAYEMPLDARDKFVNSAARSEAEYKCRKRWGPGKLVAKGGECYDWQEVGAICPNCGSKNLEETCMGRLILHGADDGYDWTNTARCSDCKWSGKSALAEKAAEGKK